MKKIVYIIIAVVVAAGIAGGVFYKLKGSSTQTTQTAFPTVTVTKGSVISTVSTSGTVVLQDQQQLAFGISGTIKEVKVGDGSIVKKGDLLAIVDTVPLQRTLDQAQANLDVANIKLEQTKNPYKDTDILAAQIAVANGQSSLISAQKSLDDYMALYATTDFSLAQAAIRNDQLTLQSALLNQQLNLRVQGNSGTIPYEQAMQDAKNARDVTKNAYKNAVWSVAATKNVSKQLLTIDVVGDDDYHLRLDPKYLGIITPDAFPQNIEDLYWAWMNADSAYQSMVTEEQKNIADLQNAVDKAKDQISKDQYALDQMNQWPKPSEVAIRKAQIENATLSLKRTQADQANILAGADPLNVALSENQVKQSQINLDTAKENLNDTNLIAPFDGVIFNTTGKLGDTVGGSTAIMQIVNPGKIRVDGLISEVDIVNIKNGQAVAMTFDALPGVAISGKVNFVSYVATKSSGVTNFLTQIGLDITSTAVRVAPRGSGGQGQQPAGAGQGAGRTGTPGKTGGAGTPGKPGQSATPGKTGAAPQQGGQPSGTPSAASTVPTPVLRDGMSAFVTITTDRRDGILTVSNKAIVTQGGNKSLYLKQGDSTQPVPITTGLSDGSITEVTSGVQEGDIIAIVPTAVRTQSPRPGTIPGIGKVGF